MVIDYYRRRNRHKQVPIEEAPTLTATQHNPVQTVEQNMDAEQLRAAIQRLTTSKLRSSVCDFWKGTALLK